MQVSWIVSKWAFNESTVYYLSHTPGAYGQCSVSDHNGSKWSKVIGQDMGLGGLALVWTILSQAITTSSALVKCWDFFGGLSVGFKRDLYHVQPSPTWLGPAAGYRSWPVVSNLHSGHSPGVYVMVKGLFHQLVNSFISLYATVARYPEETNTCAFVTQKPEEVHDVAKRVLKSLSPQLPASRTLSQSGLLHHGELGNSSEPERWL